MLIMDDRIERLQKELETTLQNPNTSVYSLQRAYTAWVSALFEVCTDWDERKQYAAQQDLEQKYKDRQAKLFAIEAEERRAKQQDKKRPTEKRRTVRNIPPFPQNEENISTVFKEALRQVIRAMENSGNDVILEKVARVLSFFTDPEQAELHLGGDENYILLKERAQEVIDSGDREAWNEFAKIIPPMFYGPNFANMPTRKNETRKPS